MQAAAEAARDKLLAKMNELSACASEAEALIPDEMLSYPTYEKLLFEI